uniref:Uncharacterized protein n=1 Tax=Anguilla anguilla TaxID=7936 RepID=A0A0E9XZF9_ANGAN
MSPHWTFYRHQPYLHLHEPIKNSHTHAKCPYLFTLKHYQYKQLVCLWLSGQGYSLGNTGL